MDKIDLMGQWISFLSEPEIESEEKIIKNVEKIILTKREV